MLGNRKKIWSKVPRNRNWSRPCSFFSAISTYVLSEKIVQIIKSITARQIFNKCPKVKQKLWGGEFWTDGYFVSTVGKHGNEDMIGKYVKNQGCQYQQIHKDMQLKLF